MNITTILLILITTFITTGCGNDGGKLGKYSNKEISEKHKNCSIQEPSGTYAITCNNILKECKRRKSNGNNACSL